MSEKGVIIKSYTSIDHIFFFRFGIDIKSCIPLTKGDKSKISDLLKRPFCSNYVGLEREVSTLLYKLILNFILFSVVLHTVKR